jgi:hypothetical protein
MYALVCILPHILSRPITWLPEKETKKIQISETENGARDDGEVNDGKKDGWTEGLTDEWMEGLTDGQMDGKTDGRMDGRIDEQTNERKD